MRDRLKPEEDLDSRRFQGDANLADVDAILASLEEEEFLQAHQLPPDDEQRILDYEIFGLLDEFDSDDWAAFDEEIELPVRNQTID
jgi:hypothetical protein